MQAVCDRIIIIDHGKIIADDTEENILLSADGERNIYITAQGEKEKILSKLKAISGAQEVSCRKAKGGNLEIVIRTAKDTDIRRAVFDCAAGGGWAILEMRTSRPTLEEIFIRLTGQGADDSGEVSE